MTFPSSVCAYALFRRASASENFSASAAKRLRSWNLADGDLGDHDGRANHVGGALITSYPFFPVIALPP
jgi:hypothetical protein